MEEAWGWLENLGKGRKQQITQDKAENEENDGEKQLDNIGAKTDKLTKAFRILHGRDKNRTENKKGKHREKVKEIVVHDRMTEQKVPKKQVSEHEGAFDATENLKTLIIQQQASLRALKLKIDTTDEQIFKLETQQAEAMTNEEEQLEFWLNELKAEEGYEKVLQMQFLDLKEKAAECKHKLEEYNLKLQGMDLANMRHSQSQTTKLEEEISVSTESGCTLECLESVTEEKSTTDVPKGDCKEKMVITRVESKLPYIVVTANEITEAQPSSPSELREWWNRWTEAQKTTSTSSPKFVHRSEIIIHLRSTRV